MPRKGKGQKVQTARGQQYGQAKMQEEAQDVVPLPQMPAPPRARPAEAGSLRRPTERPNEPLGTMAPPPPANQVTTDPNMIRPYLPALETIASQPGASRQTKAFVSRLRAIAMGGTTDGMV